MKRSVFVTQRKEGAMNPLILPILVFVLRGTSIGNLTYIDTFRMELLLDRLWNITELLEKVNRTSQMDGIVDILKEWGDLSVLLSAAGPLLGFLNHTGLLENGERK